MTLLPCQQVDHWLEYSLVRLSLQSVTSVTLDQLDSVLTARVFLVGYHFSLADIAVYSSLRGIYTTPLSLSCLSPSLSLSLSCLSLSPSSLSPSPSSLFTHSLLYSIAPFRKNPSYFLLSVHMYYHKKIHRGFALQCFHSLCSCGSDTSSLLLPQHHQMV